MKTATEVAKMIGCEPAKDPWWRPLEIKFNQIKIEIVERVIIASSGPANRGTPETLENVLEEVVESSFFATFASVVQKAESETLFWEDTHKRAWLQRPSAEASSMAPDGVCFALRRPLGDLDSRLVVGINDNKRSRNGQFTLDDRGKLVRYLGIVMEHYQLDRAAIGGSLFDGQYAQCFLLSRLTAFGRGAWKLECSTVMDCSTKNGAQLFAGFLCSKVAMGWPLSDIPACCGKFLGSGSIGHVYQHKTAQAVVKISRTDSFFWLKKERDNLKALHGLQGNPGLIQLSELDEGGDSPRLILTPLLHPICPWRLSPPVNLEQLACLVEGPVQALHTRGFVHCDLRPENIM
jgi:hypothetical protein